MSTIERPGFSERCHKEATRDVVFLFQSRELRWTGQLPSGYEFDEEGQAWPEGADREQDMPTNLSELYSKYGSDNVVESWRTNGVWLSREEANEYGVLQRHNFGEKYVSDKSPARCWRVYGVPSNGELAELLKTT